MGGVGKVDVGTPVDVVTMKVPAWPTVKVVPKGLVILHACASLTVRVNFWVAEPATFVAVIVTGYVPAAVGLPENVPVPSKLSLNVIPDGRPVADNVHVGHPVDLTVV